MHTQDELDKAVHELYKDYKDTIKDYRNGNIKILYDLNKIKSDEKKYAINEVYYIALNALALLEQDMKNNNI